MVEFDVDVILASAGFLNSGVRSAEALMMLPISWDEVLWFQLAPPTLSVFTSSRGHRDISCVSQWSMRDSRIVRCVSKEEYASC